VKPIDAMALRFKTLGGPNDPSRCHCMWPLRKIARAKGHCPGIGTPRPPTIDARARPVDAPGPLLPAARRLRSRTRPGQHPGDQGCGFFERLSAPWVSSLILPAQQSSPSSWR